MRSDNALPDHIQAPHWIACLCIAGIQATQGEFGQSINVTCLVANILTLMQLIRLEISSLKTLVQLSMKSNLHPSYDKKRILVCDPKSNFIVTLILWRQRKKHPLLQQQIQTTKPLIFSHLLIHQFLLTNAHISDSPLI